jgi:hypothetical protein
VVIVVDSLVRRPPASRGERGDHLHRFVCSPGRRRALVRMYHESPGWCFSDIWLHVYCFSRREESWIMDP